MITLETRNMVFKNTQVYVLVLWFMSALSLTMKLNFFSTRLTHLNYAVYLTRKKMMEPIKLIKLLY
jgi:hypothetical protein